jgi:hypothetical protein
VTLQPGRRKQKTPVRVVGIIVLIVGFLAKIAIVWTRGIIALPVGAAPASAGRRAVGGRRHYW